MLVHRLSRQLMNSCCMLFFIVTFLLLGAGCNRTVKLVDRRSSEEGATSVRVERAKFKVASLSKFVVAPGEDLTLQGENLAALANTKVRLEALSTASGATALIGASYEASLTISSGTEGVLKLPDELPWGLYAVKFESEASTRQLIIFSSQGNGDFSVYTAGAEAVCSGQKFVDAKGTVATGTKACMASLADCGADGATGCIATTSYAAAATTGLASKILDGATVAGVGGNVTLPAADKVSTAAGAYGVAGTSVTPALVACASDGATGCLASADYPAAMAAGLATKVLDGSTVAGVSGGVTLPLSTKVLTGTSYGVGGTASSGQLILPTAGKVLSGTLFGVFGSTTTGSLILPLEGNVVAGSSAFGDPDAPKTPGLNTSFPATPIVRPSSPTITATTLSVAAGQITLAWSAVTGVDGYLVLMSTAGAITSTPSDLVSYTSGNVIGSANVVYAGAALTTTITAAVASNTTYRFAVYSYKDANGPTSPVYSANPGMKTMYGCDALAGGTWIPVPGDTVYSTTDFCVMKYAASDVNNVATSDAGGAPWVNVTQSFAKNACQNLGAGYHLVTNSEWMTIAANAANRSDNWTGGAVGSGALVKGHSDSSPGSVCAPDSSDGKAWVHGGTCTGQLQGALGAEQRRTFSLSNAEILWDLSGNAWQWVDLSNATSKPTPANNSWQKFGDLTPTVDMTLAMLVPRNAAQSWWTDTWSTSEGVGWYRGGTNGSGGALRRGGNGVADANRSGLFTADLTVESEYADGFTSFRCAWHP